MPPSLVVWHRSSSPRLNYSHKYHTDMYRPLSEWSIPIIDRDTDPHHFRLSTKCTEMPTILSGGTAPPHAGPWLPVVGPRHRYGNEARRLCQAPSPAQLALGGVALYSTIAAPLLFESFACLPDGPARCRARAAAAPVCSDRRCAATVVPTIHSRIRRVPRSKHFCAPPLERLLSCRRWHQGSTFGPFPLPVVLFPFHPPPPSPWAPSPRPRHQRPGTSTKSCGCSPRRPRPLRPAPSTTAPWRRSPRWGSSPAAARRPTGWTPTGCSRRSRRPTRATGRRSSPPSRPTRSPPLLRSTVATFWRRRRRRVAASTGVAGRVAARHGARGTRRAAAGVAAAPAPAAAAAAPGSARASPSWAPPPRPPLPPPTLTPTPPPSARCTLVLSTLYIPLAVAGTVVFGVAVHETPHNLLTSLTGGGWDIARVSRFAYDGATGEFLLAGAPPPPPGADPTVSYDRFAVAAPAGAPPSLSWTAARYQRAPPPVPRGGGDRASAPPPRGRRVRPTPPPPCRSGRRRRTDHTQKGSRAAHGRKISATAARRGSLSQRRRVAGGTKYDTLDTPSLASHTPSAAGVPSSVHGTPQTNAGFVRSSSVKRWSDECPFVCPFVRVRFRLCRVCHSSGKRLGSVTH